MLLHAVKAALRKLVEPRVVHGFAVGTAVATFLLILVGGLVHGTGSSLACPDWPTCYGSFMPKMEGGVLVEHSHRLAAGTVVIMTLVLATMLTASKAPAVRRLIPFGWLAVGLVFVQALLGGITVILRLPTPVSTAHTATALICFLTVVYVAVRSRPASRHAARPAACRGPAPGAGGGGRGLLPDGAGRPGPALGRRARLHGHPAVPWLAVA